MSAKEVKVYSTPACPWCKKVKQFLKDNAIEYQDLNVAADSAARNEMVSKTHQMAVPVTLIDGETVLGFNEKQLREKLGL